jgi:NAD(P)-dependent dehydrogenase (short-subunit alcohol dehydrogenase family)
MSKADRFKKKVVIVTGAAQGIGRGVALQVAAEGGKVLAVDRSDLVNEVVEEIKAAKGKAVAFQADLETYAGAQAVVAEALKQFKRVDILINNVGGTIWAKPFEFYEEAQIEAEVRRSLFPTLWCCRAVLPTMIEQKSGVIVNVSSIATRGVHRVPYSAAKGGVNALTASWPWKTPSTASASTPPLPAAPMPRRAACRATRTPSNRLHKKKNGTRAYRPDDRLQPDAPLRHHRRAGRSDPVLRLR